MASQFATQGKKIVAIGRNYVEHAKELKNKVPTEPFFFLKPTTSYLQNGSSIEIPKGVVVHHEVELGVVLGSKARDVQESNAMSHVAGYALAIDMTGRNVQDKVKAAGLPWSTAKGFDTFCPIGSFIPKDKIPDPYQLELYFKINGEDKQRGPTSDMIFKIPQLIRHISSIMTLEEGDIILTGTPSGVGPVKAGDKIVAGLLHSGQELNRWEGSVKDREGGYIFSQ